MIISEYVNMFVFKREIQDKIEVIVIDLVRVAFLFAFSLFVSPLYYFFFLSVFSPSKFTAS